MRFLSVGLLAVFLTLPIGCPLSFFVDNVQAANLTWVGDGLSNDWDTISSNWTGDTSVYTDGDHVTFNDTGFTTPDVNLTTSLSPGSVTVNNSLSHDYGFSGTGSLAGGTGISKSGTGTLTVNTANTFTGVVTVNDGTLVLGNAEALGATDGGTEVNAGATLELNGIDLTNLETVTAEGAGVGGNGAIVSNHADTAGRIRQLVLDGDTTFGGNQRLDIWGPVDPEKPGVTPNFGDYTVTVKHSSGSITGHVQVRIVNTYDHTLKDVNIVQGDLCFHNATLGQTDGTITVSSDGGIKLYDSDADNGYENDVTKNLAFTGGELYLYRGRFTLHGAFTLSEMTTEIRVNSYHSTYLTGLYCEDPITGDGGITKTYNGALKLLAANTYTGATTVTDGTLRVDGSITSDTTVTGESSAHLDGCGLIQGNVTVELGNYIEPGETESEAGLGTLTVEGNADIGGTWTAMYDGGEETIGSLDVSGSLIIDEATLDFYDLTGGAETLNLPVYVFASYGSLGGIANEFATVNGLPDGYSIDYSYGGNNIALVSGAQVPGDADEDGDVDADDAERLAANWGATEPGPGLTWWQTGDFDGDNFVGPADAAILAGNWGFSLPSEATGVPEPSVAVMLLASLGTWLLWRRR